VALLFRSVGQLARQIPGARQAARLFRQRRHGQSPRAKLLKQIPAGGICVEIGVDEGDFSAQILRLTKPQCLHLIDPWQHEVGHGLYSIGQQGMDERFQRVCDRFRKQVGRGQVQIHRTTSSKGANSFPLRYCDFIYIDGNHLYPFVKQDLDLYWPKVKHGGYLAGDDYGVEGWWGNGVQIAVDEFAQEQSLSPELIGTQFVIRKS
jgi:hypothetical protein